MIPDDIAGWLSAKLEPLPKDHPRPAEGWRNAAVLIPIVLHPGAPSVILTRRTQELRNHPSQVSFPGGRVETADATPAETALREASEEIGLAPEFVKVLGALPPYETGAKFVIRPIVGLVRPGFTLKADPGEVDEIVEVPLAALLNPRNYVRHHARLSELRPHDFHVIHVGGHFIWGVTAALIVDFRHRLLGEAEGETGLSLDRHDWLCAPATRAVIAALEAHGAPARFVGGCVRNAVLGQPINDIDIATPETPERVMALLSAAGLKAIPTGLAHGTVTAIAMGKSFEVTTLRRDVETDGRHAMVEFTEDFEQDALRRDFTMNAIYADKAGILYDYVAGIKDLLTWRVRFIGDPEARIKEDYLRILRFFRFHAWYGKGAPDIAGLAACARLKDGLAQLSAERIAHELLRLLEAGDPVRVLESMQTSGILARVLPESDAEGLDALGRLRVAERARGLAPDALLRLAALLPPEPDRAAALASRLKLSNEARARLMSLAGNEALTPGLSPQALHAACYRLGTPLFCDHVLLHWARLGTGDFAPAWSKLIDTADAWHVPTFPVSGADLRARGMAEGPALGRLLAALEAAWIAEDFKSDRAALLKRLDQKTKP